MAKRKQKLSYTSISKKCSVCENEIDKSNDVSITLQNDSRKEYRLRKCTFCLDAQKPHIFERDAGSSTFILKREMTLMKENWYDRRSFINDSISCVWSTFKNELV
eukprot:NODE_343_length_10566_cov_0.542371.p9 type:complete len:105 gc:universal NODE_343_length_10566_cov_0.542371:6958-7272(+)